MQTESGLEPTTESNVFKLVHGIIVVDEVAYFGEYVTFDECQQFLAVYGDFDGAVRAIRLYCRSLDGGFN